MTDNMTKVIIPDFMYIFQYVMAEREGFELPISNPLADIDFF
jgi:hypothetical protein